MPGLWSNYEKDGHPLFGPPGSGNTPSTVADAAPVSAPEAATPPPAPPPAAVVRDAAELRARGVCRCDVGAVVDLRGWAEELAKVTPMSSAMEDGEYAQYRNILEDEDPAFPFAAVFAALTPLLEKHFLDGPAATALRLDDAFAIHYNETHFDTTVKKATLGACHTIPHCTPSPLNGNAAAFLGTLIKIKPKHV